MSSLPESVKRIEVETLAKQQEYDCYRGEPGAPPTEPDSGGVTREILEAVAVDPKGSLERATRQTLQMRAKGLPCDEVVDGILTSLLSILRSQQDIILKIADWMDSLTGDEAADLYDAYENDDIPKWLRFQAQENDDAT